MASYSIAEAKDRLPALINAAQIGEEVIITRRGEPVAVLNPVQPPTKLPIADALAELRRGRERIGSSGLDWVAAVNAMRDGRDA